MASYNESLQAASTSTALQKLEGFANRLFHRNGKHGTQEQRTGLEQEGQLVSENTLQWDRESKFSVK